MFVVLPSQWVEQFLRSPSNYTRSLHTSFTISIPLNSVDFTVIHRIVLGYLPILFTVTTLTTLVMYEIYHPWLTIDLVIPKDDPLTESTTHSFVGPDDIGGFMNNDYGDTITENDDEQEYMVNCTPRIQTLIDVRGACNWGNFSDGR